MQKFMSDMSKKEANVSERQCINTPGFTQDPNNLFGIINFF